MDTHDEESHVRSVALQNAQSILQARQQAENALRQTKEMLEEETRVLELLNKTGTILAAKLDLQNIVQTVTDAATQLSGAQLGAFFLMPIQATSDASTLYALSGATREAFDRFDQPRSTPIFSPTFHAQGVVRLGDVREDPRYGQMESLFGMPAGYAPVCSYLAVPVLGRAGDLIGGLFFGHSKPDVFSERAERLVVGVAAQAAIAIDNARMFDEAKRSADERARLLAAERATRNEIERISTMKDEFLATLSHELRTPLNAVLGWSEVLLLRAGDADTAMRRGLEAIARNARAQAQLIQDLLDMSAIISGKVRLDVQCIELGPIVEAALDAVRTSADAKAIGLRTTIDPNAGPIVGDPNRLQQVAWNLLTNAVKFTPKGGKIDLLVQRVNSHIELVIQDSGIGISRAFLPHLFERFRQADASTTRTYGGLGLGLSIVKQLVELHGGQIKAESPGEGQGATFVVTLPLRAVQHLGGSEREHPTSAQAACGRVPEVSLAGIKVLVVDDERDARELIQYVLTVAAAEVITAESANAALTLVKAARPDVIVSDIGMPQRDGFQFIRDVRGLSAANGGKTPAIALTAFARSEDRTRVMLAGYQVHVSKPIEPQELVATIKSLAGHSRGRD